MASEGKFDPFHLFEQYLRQFDVKAMMTIFKRFSQTIALLLLAIGCSGVFAQDIKVVYHVNTGVDTAAAVLGNVRNHLNADPSAKIVVVTHGPGIDFLLDGAKDNKGREFSGMVADLAGKGVQFRVCQNTLTLRNIDANTVSMDAKIVPSGVAEVARLQAKEGYVYLKP
jgi:intracellular sulfur oxidation DsrE/DsrF family protein